MRRRSHNPADQIVQLRQVALRVAILLGALILLARALPALSPSAEYSLPAPVATATTP